MTTGVDVTEPFRRLFEEFVLFIGISVKPLSDDIVGPLSIETKSKKLVYCISWPTGGTFYKMVSLHFKPSPCP